MDVALLERLATTLQSPLLVAKFQRFFGVKVGSNFNNRQGYTCQTNETFNQNVHPFGVTRRATKKTVNESKEKQNSSLTNLPKPFIKVCDKLSNNTINELSTTSSSIDYEIHNRFWFYLFSFGASLGYEVFYATFFPIWFWNIDSAVGRRMILLWVTIMYVGQALKDVIRWPRPSSPPVVSLEPEYAMEYGMPSTHAMVGIALPFSMVIFTNNRYEYPLWVGITAACFWCLLVCGSRLYLGMHSLLDIIAGLFLASLMMVILVPLVDIASDWQLTSVYSPIVTIVVILAMSIFYPKSDRWSPARGDTSVITGAGAGILMGSWLNFQLGIIQGPPLEPPFPILWPGYEVALLATLRAVIGIVCVLGSRLIGKLVGLKFLCWLRGLDTKDPFVRKRVSVEVPYKLITYVLLGITITFFSPCVFRKLDIERPTMFTEV